MKKQLENLLKNNLIRVNYPNLIASDIVSVQPMTNPCSKICYVNFYNSVFKAAINPIENKLQTLCKLFLEQITDYFILDEHFEFYIDMV